MELEQEKRRGDHAQQLLKDELLNEVLDEMLNQTLEAWENSPARDGEGREYLHKFYLATKKVRNTLKSFVETGKMANIQIERSLVEKVKTKLFGI